MLEDKEIDGILSDLLEFYGYDFNYYARDSLKRRLSRIYRLEKFASAAEFRNKIRKESDYLETLIDRITVNVTEMFRDPDFFRDLREKVLPELAALPTIRVWHAGCSSGEEAYSLAILLHEAGLLHKTQIIATDINRIVLGKARAASYSKNLLSIFSQNYVRAGGRQDFSQYYSGDGLTATISNFLRNKVGFATHNLANDGVIGNFHLIICRNVVIYFDQSLREKVFKLFEQSMNPGGFLALGAKETISHAGNMHHKFVQQSREKIWKKK